MDNGKFVTEFAKTLDAMLSLVIIKNADYSSNQEDAFANFRNVEKLWVCTVEQWILTRMSDKISRIANIIKKNDIQVKNEKITDTLEDLANYAIILKLYLTSKDQVIL